MEGGQNLAMPPLASRSLVLPLGHAIKLFILQDCCGRKHLVLYLRVSNDFLVKTMPGHTSLTRMDLLA